MAELEAAFDAPVIESYGMTEAAHQMTRNPLPPAARKPGSVGVAAGPEVAIMGENGLLSEADAIGEVLMDHPAVAQVVTFALPHDKLGEEVAAVVVLRDGAEASESDIRGYAATRLAAFKTPRKVFFRNEIPKGATGNLQRIGLEQYPIRLNRQGLI